MFRCCGQPSILSPQEGKQHYNIRNILTSKHYHIQKTHELFWGHTLLKSTPENQDVAMQNVAMLMSDVGGIRGFVGKSQKNLRIKQGYEPPPCISITGNDVSRRTIQV